MLGNQLLLMLLGLNDLGMGYLCIAAAALVLT